MCGSVGFVFFKQKTAYDMRISDWSSDVCSSDLPWLSPQPSSSGSDQGVLTLALACCRLANLVDRAQQIGGERAAAGAGVGGDRHAGGEGDLRTIAQDRRAVQRHPRGVDQSALLVLHRVRTDLRSEEHTSELQ